MEHGESGTTGLLAISFYGCKTACCESDRFSRRGSKGIAGCSDIVKLRALQRSSAQGCEVPREMAWQFALPRASPN